MMNLQEMIKNPRKTLENSIKTAHKEIHNLPAATQKFLEELAGKGEKFWEQSGLKHRITSLPYYEEMEKFYNTTTQTGRRVLDEILKNLPIDLKQASSPSPQSPIQDMEGMGVRQILPLMSKLSSKQLEQLRMYEESHQKRVTILREVERILESRKG